MEDYEFYSVDHYNPLDHQREIDTVREVLALFSNEYQRAENAIANFFQPARTINGMAIKFFGDAVMTKCETTADAEATLLGGVKNIIM